MYIFDDTVKIIEVDLFNNYTAQFGLTKNDAMVQTASGTMDSIGTTSNRYMQYNQGLPVEGTMMNVISKLGVVLYVNGFVLPNFMPDTTNLINETDALNTALQIFGAPKYAWQDTLLEAMIKYVIDTGTGDTQLTAVRLIIPKGN